MDELKGLRPNSYKYKEEQKQKQERQKLDKVVSGTVKVKKKGGLGKFADTFIQEDIQSVKSYILTDVLIPAISNTILDIITDSANMIFGRGGRSKRNNSTKISYRNYYDKKDDRRPAYESRTRNGYSHDDIILGSRGEAEEVLDRMGELIDTYGMVSVADLYDLVGISCQYTDNKYGWMNIRNAKAIRVRDGYMLQLPKVIPIDD